MRAPTIVAPFLVTLPLAAALSSPAPAQDGPILLSPEAIGQIFCLSRIGNDMAPIEGLLSPALKDAIAAAETASAAYEAANPGDKPPLGDGVPWQAYPDYAATCVPAAATIDGRTATVPLDYGFPAEPGANFRDTIMLTAIDDPMIGASRWRIDDIAYMGGGTLTDALASVRN